jgi:hypothetical protein
MKPDHVNKMGADLAVQLMLVMVFGLPARMAPDGDVFREDVRQKLSDVADTCSLPPMMPRSKSLPGCYSVREQRIDRQIIRWEPNGQISHGSVQENHSLAVDARLRGRRWTDHIPRSPVDDGTAADLAVVRLAWGNPRARDVKSGFH